MHTCKRTDWRWARAQARPESQPDCSKTMSKKLFCLLFGPGQAQAVLVRPCSESTSRERERVSADNSYMKDEANCSAMRRCLCGFVQYFVKEGSFKNKNYISIFERSIGCFQLLLCTVRWDPVFQVTLKYAYCITHLSTASKCKCL